MEKPLVSVYCLAYNHKKYIRDALDGFVNQKTTFPYEVIVHDDASTDGTADIIQEYAQKYPNIIKPIFQSDNQYSKGISIYREYILPKLNGKYIAVCEGDDYWCDENKLQFQVQWLEEHPDYSFCVHNSKVIDCETGEVFFHQKCKEDRDKTVEEILEKPGAVAHTSSYMYKKELSPLPDGFRIKNYGDYPLGIYLSMCGKVRYIHNVMSVYRLKTEGSWTVRMHRSSDSKQKVYDLYCNIIKMLMFADEFSEKKYTKRISEIIRRYEFRKLTIENDYREIRQNYYDLFVNMPRGEKTKLKLKYYFPYLEKIYNSIKNRVKK